jgi:hypothetical protein
MSNLNNVIASSIINEKQQASATGFVQTQLSSTLAAILYKQQNVTVADAVCIASCLSDALVDMEYLVDIFAHNYENTTVQSTVNQDGSKVDCNHVVGMTLEDALLLLVECKLLDDDGNIGDALITILEQDDRLYIPSLVGRMTKRHKNLSLPKDQKSGLLNEAVNVLENTEFTIDDTMYVIAKKVQATLGGIEKDPEAHVLSGCERIKSSEAYTSEFKADMRARLYQAACSGPNGQASDRSRALMDLVNVPTDYDIESVKQAVRAEIMDMVAIPQSEVGKLMAKAIKDPVGFIVSQERLVKKDRIVPKMYSFVKAALIWKELAKGNKPYIGMAVGLDAKCSGPQLASLMVGDSKIAAACGMSLTKVDDAYELAIQELSKVGFSNFTRSGVKKAYMGIFYGQGYAAYMDLAQLAKDEMWEVLDMIKSGDIEENAKVFHKAVSKSFGPAMNQLRKRFKNYAGQIEGKVSHLMPDGFKVRMNYKVKHNIHDIEVGYDTVCPDVIVSTPSFTHKFIKLSLNTSKVDSDNFVRNGFVNMIQATDAMIARLIIVHLGRLGAKHVISVHDCFRVNVTEMHLLEQAIKLAYHDLFGSETNIKTADMPMGTDIIGMYFEGIDKSLIEGGKGEQGSQFIKTRDGREVRKLRKINGHKVTDLIDSLGETYYFAK